MRLGASSTLSADLGVLRGFLEDRIGVLELQ